MRKSGRRQPCRAPLLLRATDMNKIVAPLSALILLAGCAVGPNYKKPVASLPATYRGLTPEEATKTPSASIGDQKWWDIFQDEQLRSLIRTALQQNYDLRIAASRVLQAQAQLGITRSDQFPRSEEHTSELQSRRDL